jgi:hypothetical protein
MPQTNMEIRVAQKDKLFTLHRLRKWNKGIRVKGLEGDIIEAEAKMEQEDVALVIKKVNELPEE